MGGLIHVYTGDGKGKTTAAVGLSLRAYSHSRTVFIAQFLKASDSGEVSFINSLQSDKIHVYRFESSHGFISRSNESFGAETKKLRNEAENALDFIYDALIKKSCDMLVLDEIICAYNYGIVKKDEIEDIIAKKDYGCELVLTGRGAPQWLIDKADYVTEMKAVKHPYERGINAREGIEF